MNTLTSQLPIIPGSDLGRDGIVEFPHHLAAAAPDKIPFVHFPMLKYTLFFLCSAIIAGVLGFSIMSGAAAIVAKVFFGLSLLFFGGSLLYDASAKHSEI